MPGATRMRWTHRPKRRGPVPPKRADFPRCGGGSEWAPSSAGRRWRPPPPAPCVAKAESARSFSASRVVPRPRRRPVEPEPDEPASARSTFTPDAMPVEQPEEVGLEEAEQRAVRLGARRRRADDLIEQSDLAEETAVGQLDEFVTQGSLWIETAPRSMIYILAPASSTKMDSPATYPAGGQPPPASSSRPESSSKRGIHWSTSVSAVFGPPRRLFQRLCMG